MAEATVEEKIASYISGNVKRKQIFDVLHKNGSETLESLRKLTRTPKLMLEKVLKDMEERDVVARDGDRFTLTENGKKAANVLPKQSTKSGGSRFDANIRREI
jgi:predicted transcriptional regulator